MVELFLFHFRVTNSKLKNKKVHFELLIRWLTFIVSLSNYELEVKKYKIAFEITN